jgi:hypothetical protein
MIERAFRLDFVVAICALLISGVAAGASAYQTWVINQQFGATVWPYLDVDTTTNPDGMVVALTNNGLGPALVRSAQISVDGRPASSWQDYLKAISKDPLVRNRHFHMHTSTTSVDAGTTIRSGETLQLMAIAVSTPLAALVIPRHAIGLKFCYCSLNGHCWELHSVVRQAGGLLPAPVSYCAVGARIES